MCPVFVDRSETLLDGISRKNIGAVYISLCLNRFKDLLIYVSFLIDFWIQQ